jgi:predicted ATPase/DNA-binding winged helix-turn-helix (wHTH) protein
MPNELVFSFGPFRLYPKRQQLLLRTEPVKLGGRSFELLHLLVQRSGQLVRKDELIAAAWPDVYVHYSNLKVNMSSLRRSLGDVQTAPIYIATIAGHGYRFVAPVRTAISEPADQGRPEKSQEMSGPPAQRDIVGREADIANVLADLRNKQHVTLVGAGGIGKTTIATAVARALERDYPDGVCFIDLSIIDDPSLVPVALAAALGLRGNPGDTLGAILDYVRQRRMLVILDNCEHVLPAATIFARGFTSDNGTSKLLATSREPLETPAEHVVWIDPLACPNVVDVMTAEQALRFPAVELFVRRASEWTGYELVDTDCAAVVQICRALDGLPLAIELVAAKMEHYAPHELLAMLDEHVGFQNPHSSQATPRHETLLATIDWSFRLVPQNEAIIFRLASVFADAFELDDIGAVAAAIGLKPVQVAAGLGGLVTKSLVTAQVSGAGLSYRLLDSTRRYATARRQESSMDVLALHCHARRILTLLKRSEDECEWSDVHDWLSRYRGRLADLRAALSWAFGHGNEKGLGIELAAAAIPLWSEMSLLSESQQWVASALDAADTVPCDDLLKAKLACSRAWGLFYARKLRNENEETWLAAVSYARSANSPDYHMRALLGLSYYLMQIGQIDKAIKRLEELRMLSKIHGDWPGIPDGDRALAWAKAHAGDLTWSWDILSRQAKIYSKPNKRTRMAELDVDRYISTRFYLPIVAWLNGHVDYAASAASEAVVASTNAGHLVSQANALGLGALPVSLYNGDLDALETYTEQLQSILRRERIARWVPVQRFFAAVVRDLNGDHDAVLDMRDAVTELIECRYLMRIGMYLAHLADALSRQGRIPEAQETIAMALRHQEQQRERWCRPEVQRVQASLLLRSGQYSDAKRLLRIARDEARKMNSVSFELRIVNDLASLYTGTGRNKDAARLLRPLLERFTEGSSTRDLRATLQLLRRTDGITT